MYVLSLQNIHQALGYLAGSIPSLPWHACSLSYYWEDSLLVLERDKKVGEKQRTELGSWVMGTPHHCSLQS